MEVKEKEFIPIEKIIIERKKLQKLQDAKSKINQSNIQKNKIISPFINLHPSVFEQTKDTLEEIEYQVPEHCIPIKASFYFKFLTKKML
jgi:hypothetical protein